MQSRAARLPALLAATLGAALYALMLADQRLGPLPDSFGAPYYDIYNHYYLALREGHFDLPMRVLRIEGHYTPDGTGYPYHGLAPLLTRAALGWAIPAGMSFSFRMKSLHYSTARSPGQ